ncbi:ATP-dependent nuclease [Streptomyces erythrochromogenes]|uniref:ATP-dependent nuclease n=1 Tax=Streptomyces erythrochromogenes TaxID=285574 RepID=UPI0036BB2EDF
MAVSFAVSEIMFVDGTVMVPPANGMTLFIGPNNCGKTALLRELSPRITSFIPDTKPLWIRQVLSSHEGSADDFLLWAKERGHRSWDVNGEAHLRGGVNPTNSVSESTARSSWTVGQYEQLRSMLVTAQWTDRRLQGQTESSRWDHAQPAGEPVQFLYEDPSLLKDFAAYTWEAFGEEIAVDWTLQGLQLRVGATGIPDVTPPTPELVAAYRQLPPLVAQGDGFRAFVEILLNTVLRPTPVVVIDEPEAFLHPPQARLLGRILAQLPGQTQVFVATHSADFLAGVLEARERRPLSIVRLDRTSGKPRARMLATEAVQALLDTPLLRYSNLPSGLFYDQVVLCEAAGDCQFYAATFDATRDVAGTHENTLFLQTSGLAALTTTAQHLRQCGIHTAVIADFDILREYGGLRSAFQRLGGFADPLRSDVKAVNDFANGTRVVPTVDGFRNAVNQSFAGSSGHAALSGQMVDDLMKLLKGASGWDVLKKAGLSGLQGAEHAAAQRVLDAAADLGLFIAPCGELESWVRQVPSAKKSSWSRRVFEEGWYAKPTSELQAFCKSIRAFFKDGVADYDRAAAQALQVHSELGETEASVTNASEQPLAEVRVIRATAIYEGKPIRGSLWAEGASTTGTDIAPGGTFTVELGKMTWVEHEGFFPREATELAVTVHFRDAAGLWWERDGQASPARLLNGPSEPDPRPE